MKSGDGILSDDLLDMKLHDVSDLLLQEMCKRKSSECKVTLPGTDGEGNRVMLCVRLKYD